jgi:hypothetical protein
MDRGFGLPRLMATLFLYTTPIMMLTYALGFILIQKIEFEPGIRTGVTLGLCWGILFTLSMGLVTYFKHKKLERKYRCDADYSPVQNRWVQLCGAPKEALTISVEALKTLPWIRGDLIEVSGSKISARGSHVMGRPCRISISITPLAPDRATIEIESRPGFWLPVDCTLQEIENVEEVLREIVTLSRNNGFDIKTKGDNVN